MKQLFLILVTLIVTTMQLYAAETTIKGRVIDSEGKAIAYATVILLSGEEQVTGTATDDSGLFLLKADAGSYTLRIQYVGYQTLNRPITLPNESEVGDIVMEDSATEIAQVEVMAPLIRREADRFVVDVSNSSIAIGKDGLEILETAPGVWISNDRITINGQSGSKVYINDRELKMEPQQLLQYLRSYKAEDIQKIEVVPLSGAEFDADSSGGVIKITLKRKRESGLTGSVSYTFQGGEYTIKHNPDFNLNYHTEGLDLYASGWYNNENGTAISKEQTTYHQSDMSLRSRSEVEGLENSGGGKIGAVYEINPRNTIGGEVEYWGYNSDGSNNSTTLIRATESQQSNISKYLDNSLSHNVTATLNYIHKLDTLGSNIKFITDYTHRDSDGRIDNFTHKIVPTGERDSLYFSTTDEQYRILTATLAYEQIVTPKWQIKAGAKYTNSHTSSEALYRYLEDQVWLPNSVEDFAIGYSENIGAIYAIVNGRIGKRIGLNAGLRGEYTLMTNDNGEKMSEYFSLFPNANLSVSLDKSSKHTLVASYSRSIQRPGFWALTPSRTQISDYSYQAGNPELKPQFSNNFSLNLTLWYQYSLSVGVSHNKDAIQQVMESNPKEPNQLFITWRNYSNFNNYYASASIPWQVTKWWRWNTNLTYFCMAQHLSENVPLEYTHAASFYTAMTFMLPKKFTIETSYHGQTRMKIGDMAVMPVHNWGVSLKKRLIGDKLTLSLDASNIFDNPTLLKASKEEFSREYRVRQQWNGRAFRFRLTYNFATGKSFQQRSVESGSSEEKSRLK